MADQGGRKNVGEIQCQLLHHFVVVQPEQIPGLRRATRVLCHRRDPRGSQTDEDCGITGGTGNVYLNGRGCAEHLANPPHGDGVAAGVPDGVQTFYPP